MCAGGFRLTKLASNSKDALVSILEGERRRVIKIRNYIANKKGLINIHWNTEEDKLVLDVNLNNKPNMKH